MRMICGFMTLAVLGAVLYSGGAGFAMASDEAGDLSTHPVYSGYVFGKDDKVIDFGTQPLAAPICVISEVMKHDRILREDLKGRGMEIRFHPFYKGPDINFFIKRGDIEVALSGDTPAITLSTTCDLVIPALAKQGYTPLIAKKRMLMPELKGSRIGTPPGSSPHSGLLIALNAAGMRESDVVIVPLAIDELSEALEEDRVDAISAWEPIPTALLAKHPECVVLQRYLSTNYLVFTKAFATRHPEETSLLMAAFLRALRWMNQDENNLSTASRWSIYGCAEFRKKPCDLTVEQIAEVTKTDILRIAEAPYIPLVDFEKEGNVFKTFEFLKTKGLIPGSADWEKTRAALDRGIMAEVLFKPVKYKLDVFDYDR